MACPGVTNLEGVYVSGPKHITVSWDFKPEHLGVQLVLFQGDPEGEHFRASRPITVPAPKGRFSFLFRKLSAVDYAYVEAVAICKDCKYSEVERSPDIPLP